MADKPYEPFELELKAEARRALLAETRSSHQQELELFEYYAKETTKIIDELESAKDPDDDRAERYFRRRMMYSHVIYLASLLETYLKRACSRLEASRPLAESKSAKSGRFTLQDIGGDKWDQPKRFLEVYCRFDFPECWSSLRFLADVRNVLVHDNGVLEAKDPAKRQQKRAKFENRGVKTDGFELIVEPQLIANWVEAIRELIGAIEVRLQLVFDGAVSLRVAPLL
jgi:hypothetical protein